jgi:putative ABC transport system ATP-binding protein
MENEHIKVNVEARNLSKKFELEGNKTIALKDTSFKIEEGEFVVILGPSGSGKTTLLNIIGGIDRPSKGTIIVDDTNLAELDETALSEFRCNKIGFIFQTYNLVSTLTALENIEFPMKLAGDLGDKEIETKAIALLELVGLLQRADHLPFQMSCGEQQRIAIARALANDPAIILADEPTGNLDWATGLEIIKFLKKLSKEQRKTMIIVTHDERIVDLADLTIHIKDGSIVNIAR